MKRTLLLALVLLTGCSSLKNPPTPLESKFFTVQTNQTQSVLVVTNTVYVPMTASVTNAAGGITTTNWQQPQLTITNVTNQTPYYTFTPNANAATVGTVAGAVGAPFGVGGIITSVVGLAFGLWGHLRSRQANGVAANLVQTMETARNVISAIAPQTGAKFDKYLMTAQADAGVHQAVSDLVKSQVDATSSAGTAATLIVPAKA